MQEVSDQKFSIFRIRKFPEIDSRGTNPAILGVINCEKLTKYEVRSTTTQSVLSVENLFPMTTVHGSEWDWRSGRRIKRVRQTYVRLLLLVYANSEESQ